MMPDREKVMRGLECCCTHIVGMSCGNCPYEIEQREDEGISDCTSVLAYDALALLKEQERTINELQNAYGYLQHQFFEAQDKLLKEQEVVRCKDCKQGEQSVLPNRHLWCRIHEFYREPEWYCADGERKPTQTNAQNNALE